ncbi:hypothetical protein AB8880_04975 [Alphaproteobacteria bacterium LSUCC0684]
MKFLFRQKSEGKNHTAGDLNDVMDKKNHPGPAELSRDAEQLLKRLEEKYGEPESNQPSQQKEEHLKPVNSINIDSKIIDKNEINLNSKFLFFRRRPKAGTLRPKGKQPCQTTTTAHRKPLQQYRFSRRRYLRECNGTNIPQLVFTLSIFLFINAGTIIINTVFFIPETKINQDIGKQSGDLAQQINSDQPRLSALLKRRQSLAQQAETSFAAFETIPDIRKTFSAMAHQLSTAPQAKLRHHRIEEKDNDLPGTKTLALTLEVETAFLDWLALRDQLKDMSGGAQILEETLIAPPEKSTLNIHIRLAKTGRLKG